MAKERPFAGVWTETGPAWVERSVRRVAVAIVATCRVERKIQAGADSIALTAGLVCRTVAITAAGITGTSAVDTFPRRADESASSTVFWIVHRVDTADGTELLMLETGCATSLDATTAEAIDLTAAAIEGIAQDVDAGAVAPILPGGTMGALARDAILVVG